MTDSTAPIDRRYQVFISSTFSDLDERKAAVEAVFERGHIPIALERFSPADETDLQVIKNAMKDSQVYILILGHRYGELVPGLDISYTEFEYDLAQEYGLKTLVFQMETPVIAERRRQLDSTKAKDNLELSNHGRLNKFHDRLKKHFRRFFVPGPDFKYIVQLALADGLSNWNKPGFIREPKDPAVLEGATNEFISELITQLQNFDKLYARTKKEPEKKRRVSQFFIQLYMDSILRKRVSLFFESGSTIAFLAKEMLQHFAGTVILTENGEPSIQISSNNVLAYLLLWLKARIPCTKFPWSPPVETTYGAALGGIEKLTGPRPDYSLPPLDKNANTEILRLLRTDFTLTSYRKPTLLLGAASGLQLTDNHQIVFSEEGISQDRKQELREQISKCYGPHVGGYHNKVFKRFMYLTELPIVIFLTGDKIDCPIEAGKCHFILDREYTWEQFYRTHPLAFCVGCKEEERKKYVAVFKSLDFDVIEENSASSISSFIARNAAFIQKFELELTD